jgi:hypothetical protein
VTGVQVRLVVRKGSAGVPFTLIRHRDNWLIEQIGIEEVTSRR